MSSTITYDESTLTAFQRDRIAKLKEYRQKGILTSRDYDRKLADILKIARPTATVSSPTATTSTTTTAPKTPTLTPIPPKANTTTIAPKPVVPMTTAVAATAVETKPQTAQSPILNSGKSMSSSSPSSSSTLPKATTTGTATTNVVAPPKASPPPPAPATKTPLATTTNTVLKPQMSTPPPPPPPPTQAPQAPQAPVAPKAPQQPPQKQQQQQKLVIEHSKPTEPKKTSSPSPTTSSSSSSSSPVSSPVSPSSPNSSGSGNLASQQRLSKASDVFNEASHAMSVRNFGKATQLYTDCLTIFDKLINGNNSNGLTDREQLLVMKALLARGVSYQSSKKFERAIDDFTRIIDMYNNSSSQKNDESSIAKDAQLLMLRSYMSRGNCHDSLNQFSDAVRDFDQFIHLFGTSVDGENTEKSDEELMNSVSLYAAYHNRAYAHSAMSQEQEAIDDFSRAIHQFETRVVNKEDMARKSSGSVSATGGSSSSAIVDTYFQRGKTFEMVDQVDRALEDYKTVIHYDANHARCHFRLGQLAYVDQRYGDAVKSFDKVIEHSPSDWQSVFNRGQCHKFLGHWTEAREDFEKTIAMKSSFHQAHVELARLLQRESNDGDGALSTSPEKLIQLYDQGIKYALGGEHGKPSAQALFAMYFERSILLADVDAERAVQDLDKCIALDSSNVDAHCNRGLIQYQKLRNYKEAIVSFNVVLSRDPDDEATLLDRGFAHARLAQFKEAIADFDAILKRNPDNAQALKAKAYCEQQQQQ